MKRFFGAWQRFARGAANVQIRIILTLAYAVIVPFFVLMYRCTAYGRKAAGWSPLPPGPDNVEGMKKEW